MNFKKQHIQQNNTTEYEYISLMNLIKTLLYIEIKRFFISLFFQEL